MVEVSLLKMLLNEGIITDKEYKKAVDIVIKNKKVAWFMDMLYIVYHSSVYWTHYGEVIYHD